MTNFASLSQKALTRQLYSNHSKNYWAVWWACDCRRGLCANTWAEWVRHIPSVNGARQAYAQYHIQLVNYPPYADMHVSTTGQCVMANWTYNSLSPWIPWKILVFVTLLMETSGTNMSGILVMFMWYKSLVRKKSSVTVVCASFIINSVFLLWSGET